MKPIVVSSASGVNVVGDVVVVDSAVRASVCSVGIEFSSAGTGTNVFVGGNELKLASVTASDGDEDEFSVPILWPNLISSSITVSASVAAAAALLAFSVFGVSSMLSNGTPSPLYGGETSTAAGTT